MASIFSKIVAGEIPCYKIYEDDSVLAFLDIHPETTGHILVIPKLEVDKFYDLPDDIYQHLFAVVKRLSLHLEQKLGARIIAKIIGTDVPHTHVHLMPVDPNWQHGKTLEPSEADFIALQAKLKMD